MVLHICDNFSELPQYEIFNRRCNIRRLKYYKPFLLLIIISAFLLFYFVVPFIQTYSKALRTEKINSLRKKYVLNGSLSQLKKYDFSKTHQMQSNSIAIVIVLAEGTNNEDYDIAINTVLCYSKIHNYEFVLAVDGDSKCEQRDKFFRRHCVVAKILSSFETILFIDADIGVVNPKKKIEEFMSDDHDIIFYDRFYNWEIATGSYIVKNTPFSIKLLMDFANYENKLPKSFHGTDNGALHLFLAEFLFPNSGVQLDICRKVYNESKDFADLFTYEACIRAIIGAGTDFGKIRILKKGTGWTRDGWLTNWQWHPELDFMSHGWKTNQLLEPPQDEIKPIQSEMSNWYNPLAGPIHLDKCHPGNTTWNYDTKLIGDKNEIVNSLKNFEGVVARQKISSYCRISKFL